MTGTATSPGTNTVPPGTQTAPIPPQTRTAPTPPLPGTREPRPGLRSERVGQPGTPARSRPVPVGNAESVACVGDARGRGHYDSETMAVTDPSKLLGLAHSATDAEIRAAYRQSGQRHHPDHNGGSPESTRQFEAVQEAYALIRKLQHGTGTHRGSTRAARPLRGAPRRRRAPGPVDPGLDARLAALDRELKRQREAKQQAQRNAQRIREDALRRRGKPHAPTGGASDEDLGYVSTDDSFSAILDDAASEFSQAVLGGRAVIGGEAGRKGQARLTCGAGDRAARRPVRRLGCPAAGREQHEKD